MIVLLSDCCWKDLIGLLWTYSREIDMRFGIIGLILLVLLVAALLQNVYIGGLGGLLLIVLVVLLITGRL